MARPSAKVSRCAGRKSRVPMRMLRPGCGESAYSQVKQGAHVMLMLNNGVQMPAIGLGVFQTPPAETTSAVEAALSTGYRHIDTAAAYGNEREVGDGIRRSGLDRSDVFIETKVWISDYGYDTTLHAFDKSAAKLGVHQIDLLILHQPLPTDFDRTIEAY